MGVLHPRGPAATGVAVLLAALCISHVSGATDPWEGDVDTVILDNSNFTQSIQSRKLVMVEFYTPWCGHCRQFAADYAKAATELKKEGLVLAKVNLDKPENHPLAQQFQVSGFPTIRIFKRMYDSDKKNPLGTMEAYDVEPRTKEGVLQQMRVLGLPPKRLKTAEDVAKAVADDVENSESRVSVLVVGVFADKKGPAYLAFKEAWFGRSTPRYVWVKAKDRALVAQYIGDAAGDVVAVITKFDDVPSGAVQILPASAMEDVDQIVRFVDIHSAPLVWRYNDALSSRVTTGKLQKFLWAFVDQKSEHWATYEKAATEVAVAERGKMKVVLVAETNLGVLNYFKIDPASLPQVLVIDVHPEVGQRQFKLGNWDAKARSYDTSEAQDMSAAKLLKFVGEYNDGKLKRFLRSEPVPAEQPGPVIKVVGSTFEETIASGKDVLVNFGGDYSWCEHCKLFAPEYVIIANALAGTGIVCADMDFPSNDVEDARKRGLQPAGFPELFLFRAGDHTKPIKFEQDKYNGERGMRAIIQFVKDHAALPFQLQGETFGAKPRAEL